LDVRSSAWKFVLIGGAFIIAGYFLLPPGPSRDWFYSALGVLSVACILVGVHLHRPKDRLSWYLLALAGAFFTLGDDMGTFYELALHTSTPFPSLADAFYLAGYPFLFVGVLRLTHDPSRSSRREETVDAAIVTVGALAISWHFLMNSYVHDGSLSAFGKLVTLAYPVMDTALVFVLCGALLFGVSKQPFHLLLASAIIAMFVGDFAYDLLVLHNSYTSGNAIDALFLLEYVLIAAAALHPSIATAPPDGTELDTHRQESRRRRRMPVVALAAFIPPLILIAASSLNVEVNVPVMAALCVGVLALVYLRMMWMIRRIHHQNLEIAEQMVDLETLHLRRDELEMSLRHQAFHDELTGLANRSLLHNRVEHALSSMERSGKLVALCFGDLDGFKTINDTLGHIVGDAVLVQTGMLLESIVRPTDTVARLGGDEFAILLVELDGPDVATDFAHRMVDLLREAQAFKGGQAGISMSVGVAVANATTQADQLISEADAAMYEAKALGKDRVEVFESSIRNRLLERLELTGGFGGSLERSEYYLDYQPVFSLSDGKLHSFEALVRWHHPTKGLVSPLDFISLAEETGFMVPLGRWVMFEACERLAAWSAIGGDSLELSVNVSRRQLVSPTLVDDIRTALAITGLSPQRLVLEITESILMDNPEQASATLLAIRALGVRIAVDDFGTGYSSLSYLQRFPVDVLKVDKSFIDSLTATEDGSSALVDAIIGLAHSLDLSVVAEGIEREDQYQRLVDLHCDLGQGYLMSRPLDSARAEDLVQEYERRSTSDLVQHPTWQTDEVAPT
jgi:diguanylate cyclase